MRGRRPGSGWQRPRGSGRAQTSGRTWASRAGSPVRAAGMPGSASRRQAGPRVRRRARTSNTMWTTPLAVDGPVAGGGPRSLPTAATAAAADDHSATSRRGSTILLSVFGTHCQRRRLNSLEMNIATASRRGACDSRPLGDGTLPSYNGICTQAQFPPRQNFGPELQPHGAGRTRPAAAAAERGTGRRYAGVGQSGCHNVNSGSLNLRYVIDSPFTAQ
jgi:hypothetical protein